MRNPIAKIFEPRCKHRHTKDEHPQCFARELKGTSKLPKILILDIETAPMEVYVFALKDNNYISPANGNKDFFIISWSAKWLFYPDTMSDVVTPDESLARDDNRIMKSLWNLVNQADIIVAHNGRGFDFKKMNSRFILNGFPPPSSYETVDTLQVARSIFGFSSNALTYLNLILGLDIKSETGGMSLWIRCVNGDQSALLKMQGYNRNDVDILEELYIVLRPWIKSHPNCGLYMEISEPVCRNCGSTKLTVVGTKYTPVGIYESTRCECGAVGRLRTNILPKEKREKLVV
jgi:hypothetical protein